MITRTMVGIFAGAVVAIGCMVPGVRAAGPVERDTPTQVHDPEFGPRTTRVPSATREGSIFPPPHMQGSGPSATADTRQDGPSAGEVNSALNDVYSTGKDLANLRGVETPVGNVVGFLWDYGSAYASAADAAKEKGEGEGMFVFAKESSATYVGNSLAPLMGAAVVAGGSWAVTGACMGFLAKKAGQALVRAGFEIARVMWDGKAPESYLGKYVEGEHIQDPLARWQHREGYYRWAQGLSRNDRPTEKDYRIWQQGDDPGLAVGGHPSDPRVFDITGGPDGVSPGPLTVDGPVAPKVSRALGLLRAEVPEGVRFDGTVSEGAIDYREFTSAIRDLPEAEEPDREVAPSRHGADATLARLQNEVRGAMLVDRMAGDAVDAENERRRGLRQAQLREQQRRAEAAAGAAIGQALGQAIQRELAGDKGKKSPSSGGGGNSGSIHRTEPQRLGAASSSRGAPSGGQFNMKEWLRQHGRNDEWQKQRGCP